MKTEIKKIQQICWICGSNRVNLFKPSNIQSPLSSHSFAITDSHYSQTAELYRCQDCGFLQAVNLTNVLSFYEKLEDPSYEQGRFQRAIQARKIVETAKRYKPCGRILDIGAGSGILVEEARKSGYDPQGIEPSEWLVQKAKEHNLNVILGTLPHPNVKGPFDVVFMVDVIEHVSDPLSLLNEAKKVLANDGVLLIITPDVNSFLAKIMGFKWWHYRVAHIGYFNRKNFDLALKKSGFEQITIKRPSWYFSLDYLTVRFNTYLPKYLRLPVPAFFKKITTPLNLRDSLLGVFRLKKDI